MSVRVFSQRPLAWALVPVGLAFGFVSAFVIFRPVQVVPRIAAGPSYQLADQEGNPFSEQDLLGRIALYGFGYTHDPTPVFQQTLLDMRRFQAWSELEGVQSGVALVLILFDDQRDTAERRAALAVENGLDPVSWILLGGDAESLKHVIGQGFGVYYEAVPISELPHNADISPVSGDYGYLQAQRYILVDERSIIRAEYRAPLDLERAMRDVRLMIREMRSTGAARTLNEAAHLFMCYPK